MASKAAALHLDSPSRQSNLYMLSFLQKDQTGMSQASLALADKPDWGDVILYTEQGEAVAEFRRIIERPGLVQNGPIAALARLGLARAYAQASDKTQAKISYQDFLRLWQDADQDLPLLRAAHRDYAQLLKRSP